MVRATKIGHFTVSLLALVAVASLPPAVRAAPALALQVAQASHVPTEEQLDRRLHPERDRGDVRTYQQRSVDSFGARAQRASAWIRDRLSGFHVTPARLALALGLVGILLTWNRNKRKRTWLALAASSYLLAAAGVIFLFLR